MSKCSKRLKSTESTPNNKIDIMVGNEDAENTDELSAFRQSILLSVDEKMDDLKDFIRKAVSPKDDQGMCIPPIAVCLVSV